MINRPRAGEPTSVHKPGEVAAVIAALRSKGLPSVPSSRPRLPPALLGRSSADIDWRLTMIAAFSFLAHFGVVDRSYSDWLDPLIDDGPDHRGARRRAPDCAGTGTFPASTSSESTVLIIAAPSQTHGGPTGPAPGRVGPRTNGGGDRAVSSPKRPRESWRSSPRSEAPVLRTTRCATDKRCPSCSMGWQPIGKESPRATHRGCTSEDRGARSSHRGEELGSSMWVRPRPAFPRARARLHVKAPSGPPN